MHVYRWNPDGTERHTISSASFASFATARAARRDRDDCCLGSAVASAPMRQYCRAGRDAVVDVIAVRSCTSTAGCSPQYNLRRRSISSRWRHTPVDICRAYSAPQSPRRSPEAAAARHRRRLRCRTFIAGRADLATSKTSSGAPSALATSNRPHASARQCENQGFSGARAFSSAARRCPASRRS